MSSTDSVRYNINADRAFDTALRETVKGRSISAFFIEAALKEMKRLRKEQAMQLVQTMPNPLSAIPDSTTYIHNLRREDAAHLSP